jgi:hypothetical protein
MNEVKTQCLRRLEVLTTLVELVDFLRNEKLMDDYAYNCYKFDSDKPKFLFEFVEEQAKQEKILLCDYSWVLLPEESIRVRVVTQRNQITLNYSKF